MNTIPTFQTEQDEAEFWDLHDSTEFLDDTEAIDLTFVDARPSKKQISLRLEQATIDQLKSVARAKGLGYQTLIRMWLVERLHQEAA
jgi:predicted DNA binding CopG/RHH family protein